MAQNKNNINLTEILLQCMGKADPMLEMLKWLCNRLMEAELSDRIGADKHERSDIRSSYRCGLPAQTSRYTHGHHVSAHTQSQARRLYPVLHNRTQAQRSRELARLAAEAFMSLNGYLNEKLPLLLY